MPNRQWHNKFQPSLCVLPHGLCSGILLMILFVRLNYLLIIINEHV